MKIFFKLFLLWNIIVLNNANNAKLHRQPIHRHKGPFKTMGNILAEKQHFANKFNLEFNQTFNCANLDTINSNFYSYILIGTPPQKVKVTFSTAYAVLGLPPHQYFSNLSTTSMQEFHVYVYNDLIEYGDEWYSDDEVRDNVQVAGLFIPGQTIFTFAEFQQGIFGLALRSNPSYIQHQTYPAPMESLYNQNVLPENKFSMYLVAESASAESEYGGEVIFGGSDPTLYSGNLTYVDVVGSATTAFDWGFQVQSLSFMGKTIYQNFIGILDSGTDMFYCPGTVYNAIIPYLNVTLDSAGNNIVDCNKIDSFPNLEFTVAGKNITVAPSAYILKYLGTNGSIECMATFEDGDMERDGSIVLGTPFMTQQYFEFDGVNSKIGFAPLVPYTGSTNALPFVPQNILPKKVCKSN